MSAVHPSASISFGSRVHKSPFYEATRRWGCNAFSVYNHIYMPLYYESPEAEYWSLVSNVVLWDVACQRQVEISGPDAYDFVRLLTPRNLAKHHVGQAKYVPLVNQAGGMINDPVLFRIDEDRFWFSLADSDVLLWAQGVAHGLNLDIDITEPDVSPLQLQGPKATEVMRTLSGAWVLDLKYFWFRETEIDGIPVVVSRTGWSNERGYEIFLRDASRGDELWERVMAAGGDHGITPAAPSQIKRMEAGLLSYHNDMNLSTNPFEVGLGKFVDLDQAVDFVGKSSLRKFHETGLTRQLKGALIDGDPIAVNEHRWTVFDGDTQVGELTSCVYSPALDKNLAYLFLEISYAEPETRMRIITPDGERSAIVCDLPFVANRANT
ncbi:MAG: glycine cleavage system protein T [Gammaproteobacteria bacterium]|nr:MAG: glycine cleavage system protein T [Gammaproteobacteria bacterium]